MPTSLLTPSAPSRGSGCPATSRVPDVLATPGPVRHAVPAAGASVMGTGVVGIAAHTLPVTVIGLGVLADISWALAAALLVAVVAALALQAVRHRAVAKAHLLDRRTAPGTGTIAMAFLTVGTATLLIGPPALGAGPSLAIDIVLFTIGTLLGLATILGVPLLLLTRTEERGPTHVSATWLLPVVPPMVSAAAGGLLAQHFAVGQLRTTFVVGCLGLFGMSLLAALLMISLLWARLLLHGEEPIAAAPSVWVVLDPLGQGATALSTIAAAAKGMPAPYPAGLDVVALVGGASLLGFAALWAALATVVTVRARRRSMGFSLGWWSLTFPVGTCVTGLSALAIRMDLVALRVAAVAAFAGLCLAWVVVARGTGRGLREQSLTSPLAAA